MKNDISKSTATRDIKEIEEKAFLVNKGTKGSSAVLNLFSKVGSVGSGLDH